MADTVITKRHAPKGPIKGENPIQPATPCKAQCTATSRTGKRCANPPILGATVCRMHGGSAPQVKAKARERLSALYPEAVQKMGGLLRREQFPTVQFQASRFLIEQEVGKAIEHVEQTHDGVIELVWGSE